MSLRLGAARPPPYGSALGCAVELPPRVWGGNLGSEASHAACPQDHPPPLLPAGSRTAALTSTSRLQQSHCRGGQSQTQQHEPPAAADMDQPAPGRSCAVISPQVPGPPAVPAVHSSLPPDSPGNSPPWPKSNAPGSRICRIWVGEHPTFGVRPRSGGKTSAVAQAGHSSNMHGCLCSTHSPACPASRPGQASHRQHRQGGSSV